MNENTIQKYVNNIYLHVWPNYVTKLFTELCHIRVTFRKTWNNDETLDLQQIMQNEHAVVQLAVYYPHLQLIP